MIAPLNKCQYGEESIILPFFQQTVVDVGAADGISYSNSRMLIERGWRGILIEPEPRQFKHLQRLYADRPDVICLNYGVAKETCVRTLHPGKSGTDLLGSTFNEEWIGHHGMQHADPITVQCCTLKTLLDAHLHPQGVTTIDFLTIDAEGMDLEVLQGMDWDTYDVRLICVESGDDGKADDPLNNYLKSLGFTYHAHTRGNTFWKPAEPILVSGAI